jgi:hypothetical protein
MTYETKSLVSVRSRVTRFLDYITIRAEIRPIEVQTTKKGITLCTSTDV